MYPPEEWWEFAECALVDEETRDCFFSDDEYTSEENEVRFMVAQAVCSSCPAIEMCLAYALDTGEKYGVWGMHTPKQRRNLKRQMSRRPENAQRYWQESFEKVEEKMDSAMIRETAESVGLASV